MDLEVQEDKILSSLVLILSMVLGVSYILTIFLLSVIFIYSLYKRYNFKFKKVYLLFLINIIVCIYYRNYLGILVNVVLILFFYLSYLKNMINLDIVIKYSAFMGLIEIFFSLILQKRAGFYNFLNPNYYGAYLALLILLYLFKKYDRKYLIIFIISLLLTGSRFALVSLIFTYATYLFIKNKRRGILAISIILIYFYFVYKGILPFVRSDTINEYLDLRLWIYKLGIMGINKAMFLGHGPTYFYKFSNYIYPHSHNLFIETILSYGILGLMYIVYLCKDIKLNHKKILLITLIFIHGMADYTIMWIQTGLLFIILFNEFE